MSLSFGNIREGMNVCDVNGDKVGTIKTVYRLGRTVGGGTYGGPVGGVSPTTEGYLHVDTGFLGLGKDLYIPFNSIRDCNDDCCFLNVSKDTVDRMGWDKKPINL